MFWPLITTGAGETVFQAADKMRFVADCKVKPVALVGHVRTTLFPERVMVNCGGRLADSSERLNTVPTSELPPWYAVPYRVLPDKIKSFGNAPSLFMKESGGKASYAEKLYKLVNPVPFVLTAKTVPFPALPPSDAAPYRVLPDKLNPIG